MGDTGSCGKFLDFEKYTDGSIHYFGSLILYDGITDFSFIYKRFFFFYGLGCFYSPTMYKEFERFGLSKGQRKITGFFQVLGACGLSYGFYFNPILGFSAALGLSVFNESWIWSPAKNQRQLRTILSFFIFCAAQFICLLTNSMPC